MCMYVCSHPLANIQRAIKQYQNCRTDITTIMIPDIRVTCILRASLLVEVHAKNYVIYNQGTISIDLFQKPKVKLKRVV